QERQHALGLGADVHQRHIFAEIDDVPRAPLPDLGAGRLVLLIVLGQQLSEIRLTLGGHRRGGRRRGGIQHDWGVLPGGRVYFRTCGLVSSRSANPRASTLAATSWTRTICAPASTATVNAAKLAASRSAGGCSGELRRKDFRDRPTSSGRPSW